jgi:toxin ParE1/3/4
MYQLVISDLASKDLEHIFQYSIETFGERKTLEYLENLHLKLEQLEKMPGIGHIHISLDTEIRIMNYESHNVLYKINENDLDIEILRIVHQKINLNNLFKGQ